MNRIIYIVVTLSFAIVAVLYKEQLENYYNILLKRNNVSHSNNNNNYTPEELAEYNGIIKDKVYLAVLGSIFDVSKGIKHYGQGSPYNYFVGKDGSRSLITGNFKDESNNKDHILDLTCDELLALLNWKKTFKNKYKYVGTLIGRYYTNDGWETPYMKQFIERIDYCKELKEAAKKEDRKYPPCNISWSAEEGTRVWCTTNSGGISRSWVGVPRQLYIPGQEKPRCVCVNMDGDKQTGLFKEYENCSSTSTFCYINS